MKELIGTVTNGLGEGREYMLLELYEKQFVEKLRFKPFPGTLNIIVKNINVARFIRNLEHIRIDGVKTKDRIFGALDCYLVKIRKMSNVDFFVDAAIIFPEKTRHSKDIVEVIAPISLRRELGLHDGEIVRLWYEND